MPGQLAAFAAPAHDVRTNVAKSSNSIISREYGRFAMNKECLRNSRVGESSLDDLLVFMEPDHIRLDLADGSD